MQTATSISLELMAELIAQGSVVPDRIKLHEEPELPEVALRKTPQPSCEMFEGGLGI